jgi:glycosyltransferase involved in cell wall biosynthesis
MADEYMKHGLDSRQVHHLPWIPDSSTLTLSARVTVDRDSIRAPTQDDEIRLMFLSRMDHLKGGHVLCAALPLVAEKLDRSIHVTFAGDGPERQKLQARADALNGGSRLRFEFPGWVSSEKREELFERSHLLIVPSLWPEPGGFVGLEACLRNLPVVAFDSGGIKEWLHDGVNGFLASNAPPTASGLASAILKVFQNPATYASLCEGAAVVAKSFSHEAHLQRLLALFREVIREVRTQN